MSNQFRPTVINGDNWAYVRIQGVIDQDNRLEALAREIRSPVLVVDLADVERINSRGVRDWVNWIAGLDKAGIKSYLVQCSTAVVGQLNLVGNFAGQADVCSVSAPYYCEACEFEHAEVLHLAELATDGKTQAPTRICPQCKKAMSFDDIEDSFFAFVKSTKSCSTKDADAILNHAYQMLGEEQLSTTDPSQEMLPLAASKAHEETYRDRIDRKNQEPVRAKAQGELSRTDMLFYIAVKALSALLLMLIYHIAVP
jgi:anti-anti-sigma regulatory factor